MKQQRQSVAKAVSDRQDAERMRARLQAFLYLLMRDKLPTSDIIELVQNIEKSTGGFVFTAKPLADYADELAGRIMTSSQK